VLQINAINAQHATRSYPVFIVTLTCNSVLFPSMMCVCTSVLDLNAMCPVLPIAFNPSIISPFFVGYWVRIIPGRAGARSSYLLLRGDLQPGCLFG